MSCPYSRGDLSAYIDAEMDEAAQAGIREHLRTCAQCRREVAWLKTVAGMVAGLPRAEPEATVTWAAEAPEAAPRLRCPVVLPEASAFIDGELPREEAHAVVAHLAGCEPCHRAYRDIERISEVMTATEPAAVPAGLEARILEALAAERRFSLRRFFSRTCEVCFPVARVSLRYAAAAALLLLVGLGAWHLVGPGPQAPLVPVVVPSQTVAAAPTVGNPAPAPGAVAARPTRPLERRAVVAVRPAAPRVIPAADHGSIPPPTERSTEARGSEAPTVVRPPGGPIATPVGPGPANPAPPRPAESTPRTMVAALSPSQPASPSAPGAPVATRPPSLPGKSTPQGEGIGQPEPSAVRVAELPAPAPREADPDVHVHVARSGYAAPAPVAAGGLAPDHLRAAEERLNASMRVYARSQPKRFPINP